MQFAAERAKRVRSGKALLGTVTPTAIDSITQAVLDGALHCCTTAGFALLRELAAVSSFRTLKRDKGYPVPTTNWANTVFSDEVSDEIEIFSAHFKQEVSHTAGHVGVRMPQLDSDESVKSHYLDFFRCAGKHSGRDKAVDFIYEAFKGTFPNSTWWH